MEAELAQKKEKDFIRCRCHLSYMILMDFLLILQKEILERRIFTIDEEGFKNAMEEQREKRQEMPVR